MYACDIRNELEYELYIVFCSFCLGQNWTQTYFSLSLTFCWVFKSKIDMKVSTQFFLHTYFFLKPNIYYLTL